MILELTLCGQPWDVLQFRRCRWQKNPQSMYLPQVWNCPQSPFAVALQITHVDICYCDNVLTTEQGKGERTKSDLCGVLVVVPRLQLWPFWGRKAWAASSVRKTVQVQRHIGLFFWRPSLNFLGSLIYGRIQKPGSGYWGFCKTVEEVCWIWVSWKGEVSPGMEEQVSSAAPVHNESYPSWPHDLCSQVGVLLHWLYDALAYQATLGRCFLGNRSNSGICLDLFIMDMSSAKWFTIKGSWLNELSLNSARVRVNISFNWNFLLQEI